MTYEQEIKEALKAIRCYEREKKAGKLKVARKASDFLRIFFVDIGTHGIYK